MHLQYTEATVEVIRNPTWIITQTVIILSALTALTFIAIVLIIGIKPDEIIRGELEI